jgi:tetratricopeptide (TPR) repeat protein
MTKATVPSVSDRPGNPLAPRLPAKSATWYWLTGAVRAAAAVLALAPGAVAADDPGASDAEKAMIPKWCAFATAARNTSNAVVAIKDPLMRSKISNLDNAGCNGYHHYCWAQIWTNRALLETNGKHNPDHFFGVAISDYEYVLKLSANTCPLNVEMYTKIGEIYSLTGRPADAEQSLRKALSIKSSYAPAYIGLSDLFETQGNPNQAIAALQAGIKNNPKSTALKKKLLRVQQRYSNVSTQP